jgi:hypothetical protein
MWNQGSRNWLDALDGFEHSHWWGLPYYYDLTGDEWAHEQVLQGYKDTFLNPYVTFANSYSNQSSNSSAGHGHCNGTRACGEWESDAASTAFHLLQWNDADADTAAGWQAGSYNVPGTAIGSTTPMSAMLNELAVGAMAPFIRGGFPAGWPETSSTSPTSCIDPSQSKPADLCSEGTSPLTGFMRPGQEENNCSGTVAPCADSMTNTSQYRTGTTFQRGTYINGLYDAWQFITSLLGPNWHVAVGPASASGGYYFVNGATSFASATGSGVPANTNSVVSDWGMRNVMYAGGLSTLAEHCVNSGSFTGSGCIYAPPIDYPATSPGCTSSSNCLLACPTGCHTLTNWFAIDGMSLMSNNIADLTGAVQWYPIFASVITTLDASMQIELGSHMIQQGINYIIANGSQNGAFAQTISPSVPSLTPLSFSVTGCTGTGCSHASPTGCIGPTSGTGTCTITWTKPTGLSSVYGQSYLLEYLPCQSGHLTIYGNDCPALGKTIVPSLGFSSTGTGTCGSSNLIICQTVPGPGATQIQIGTTAQDPTTNQPVFAAVPLPDCGNGNVPCPGYNSVVPGTGCTVTCVYTFNTQPNVTYQFYLAAYGTSAASLVPTSQAFYSAAVGTSSGDSPRTFTLTAGSSNLASLVISTMGDFSQTNTCGVSLTAGASCTISVIFTATATGSRTGTVVATYTGGSLSSTLSGFGLAAGSVIIIPPNPCVLSLPATANGTCTFQSQTVGLPSSDSPEPETLSNTSGAAATSLSTSFTGADPGDFTSPSTTCGSSLANNSICQINTTFTPAIVGARTANLKVSYGGGGGPTIGPLADCNEPTLATALTSVSADNTTVLVPSGTCTWTSPLIYNPTFTTYVIFGNGGTTTLNDAVIHSSGSMFQIQIPVGKTFRISGATIQPLSTNPANYLDDMVSVLGTCNSSGCPNFRLDHMVFTGSTGSTWNSGSGWQMDVADVFGVADHNTVTYPSGGGIFGNVSHASYLGVGQYGDNSWTQPDSLGTNNAFYFEDNTITAGGSAPQPALIVDCDHSAFGAQHVGACRMVLRHNTLISAGGTVHGTESGGRSRGGRQIEIYGNQFTCNTTAGCSNGFQARSGVVYEFGNTYTTGSGSFFNGFLQLAEFRRWANLGGWDTCNGAGPWDNNDGVVYATGTITATSGSGGAHTLVVTDTSQSWTTNQWAPGNGSAYSIVNLTLGNTYGWEISSSTSNSVSSTLYSQDSYNSWPVFNVGDTYQILKSSVCIDQPSRILSTLLSGATPPTGWVNEVLDPSYEWNDTLSPGSIINFGLMGSQTLSLIANRDWYQESATSQTANTSPTSPFNGTSGTGWGIGANRPISCSLSVSYFATNVGSQGTLYQCQSGAWVSIYQPYTYPHPLTTSSGGSVSAPLAGTGLGATVTLAPSTYAFNSTVAGSGNSSDSPQTFIFTNGTAGTVTPGTVSLSNAVDFNIQSNGCTAPVTAGNTCLVTVNFSPAITDIGTLTSTLSIAFTGASGSPVTAALSGVSTSPTTVFPNNPITPMGVAIK